MRRDNLPILPALLYHNFQVFRDPVPGAGIKTAVQSQRAHREVGIAQRNLRHRLGEPLGQQVQEGPCRHCGQWTLLCHLSGGARRVILY